MGLKDKNAMNKNWEELTEFQMRGFTTISAVSSPYNQAATGNCFSFFRLIFYFTSVEKWKKIIDD